jgi:ribokinase
MPAQASAVTARVLVVGALNVDLVVACDRLPGPGETVVGPRVDHYGGGKGANAAVAAVRAGAEVRFCGAVGADNAGSEALSDLRAEGIDVSDVSVIAGVPTGMALIVVDAQGENQIAVGAGANAAVSPASVVAAVERSVGWAGCILVSAEIPPASVAAVLESAAAHGIRCVLNPAPVNATMLDLLTLAPLLTPNASELVELYGLLGGESHASVANMAWALSRRTNAPVIVTLGEDGVMVCEHSGKTTRLSSSAIADVKDTTGAGDTFNGVFAASLADGASLLQAVSRGVFAATLSVGSIGARSGMPRKDALDAARVVKTEDASQ